MHFVSIFSQKTDVEEFISNMSKAKCLPEVIWFHYPLSLCLYTCLFSVVSTADSSGIFIFQILYSFNP